MFRELVLRDPDNGANIDRKLESEIVCTSLIGSAPKSSAITKRAGARMDVKLAVFRSCNLPLSLPAFCGGARRTVGQKKKDEGNGDLRDNRQYSLAAFCIIKGEPCGIMTASVPWLVKEFPFLFQRCWHFWKIFFEMHPLPQHPHFVNVRSSIWSSISTSCSSGCSTSKSCCFCCFCCCYLNTGKTARIVLVVIWCHDSSGPVHANRLHTKMRTQLCMNTWQNLHVNGKRNSTFHTCLASLCFPSPNKWNHSSLPFCLYGQL